MIGKTNQLCYVQEIVRNYATGTNKIKAKELETGNFALDNASIAFTAPYVPKFVNDDAVTNIWQWNNTLQRYEAVQPAPVTPTEVSLPAPVQPTGPNDVQILGLFNNTHSLLRDNPYNPDITYVLRLQVIQKIANASSTIRIERLNTDTNTYEDTTISRPTRPDRPQVNATVTLPLNGLTVTFRPYVNFPGRRITGQPFVINVPQSRFDTGEQL